MADQQWAEAKIEELCQEARKAGSGETGERRAAQLRAFLANKLAEYSQVLGETEANLLEAIEKHRTYSAVNYYQEANFPSLQGVTLIDDVADFKRRFPSGKYTCPMCAGESTDPYNCNSGKIVDSKPCNWKAYGLFGTMGKGLRIALRNRFLEHPKVDEIFAPVEISAAGAPT